ncbi:hypothetical protein [Microbulbifer sp. ALW1]|uniref:glycine-rich domain-containing protein n=1 Tax=Microbulbifer sp. (strain ALW1) TaxID=1516059 RepID=UPI0013590466|nr:hypothetical protein [Microbulbifer sp. ALW1]
MQIILPAIFITILTYTLYRGYQNSLAAKRAKLIDAFQFPNTITTKIIDKYPHLSESDARRVLKGLREYFHVCNIAGNRMVAMPSQVVDVAWHEFILFTRKYEHFCNKALGRFLHHTPAEAMKSPTLAQSGIKRAWRISCYRENIKPKAAHKLPLLFAIDAHLEIPDGFNYALDCTRRGCNDYCAGHIGCGSGCSGGCAGGSSGSDGGCGGGCGGD